MAFNSLQNLLFEVVMRVVGEVGRVFGLEVEVEVWM
jgi:hypothetical protein